MLGPVWSVRSECCNHRFITQSNYGNHRGGSEWLYTQWARGDQSEQSLPPNQVCNMIRFFTVVLVPGTAVELEGVESNVKANIQ